MMPEKLQKQIDSLWGAIESIRSNPAMPDHQHTGLDVSSVKWENLAEKKQYESHTIIGASAATTGNYGVFYINERRKCYVSGFWESHQVAGSDAGAVTLDLEKLTSGQAPNSGVSVLASTLSLKATANVPQEATLTATNTNRNLAIGDRLCLKDSGVLTSVSNVTVIVELTLI